MKKITAIIIVLSSSYLSAITSTMAPRTVTTEPLLYSMIDYSKQQLSIEASPFFLSMYDPEHVNQNIMLNGQSRIKLDQRGDGDINPTWLNLISNNTLANYRSDIILKPQLSEGGMLLHLYKEYKHFYFDVRTAILECSTQINMEEIGTKNGAISGVQNALQAFTQDDWNYGKIGNLNQVAGVDDIQIKLGGKAQTTADIFNVVVTGFGLVQAPTGSGTKAEWLFEPQIGTNHWGLGGGFEMMMYSNDLKFLLGGDYRYFMPAWETRSFDLIENGQWSRYLGIQEIYGLPIAPSTNPLPGINYLTQSADIQGRNQINMYARLEKKIKHCAFELSYNFFYKQEESIGSINDLYPHYGIYTLTGPAGGGGAVVTSSGATISQDVTPQDHLLSPVIITTAMFDKNSAQIQSFTSNSLTARIQRFEDTYNYGIGFNIESAQSAGAMSSWAIWAKFEYLFTHKYDHHVNNNSQQEFITSELFEDIKNNAADNDDKESYIQSTYRPDSNVSELLQNYMEDIEFYESENISSSENDELLDEDELIEPINLLKNIAELTKVAAAPKAVAAAPKAVVAAPKAVVIEEEIFMNKIEEEEADILQEEALSIINVRELPMEEKKHKGLVVPIELDEEKRFIDQENAKRQLSTLQEVTALEKAGASHSSASGFSFPVM